MTQKNILLIDDDADDQLIFTDALGEISDEFTCITVKTGIEALVVIKSLTPIPSIIFLDLNMPLMNGFEFLSKIKRDLQFQHIPVVILTTSDNPVDKKIAENLGAAIFLTKTADFKLLKTQLSEVLTANFIKSHPIL